MFSACALPERGRASAINVNKLTDFQYASLFSALNPKARNEMFEGEGGTGLVGQLHVRMSFDYSPQSALPATLCMHNTQLEMRVSEELI